MNVEDRADSNARVFRLVVRPTRFDSPISFWNKATMIFSQQPGDYDRAVANRGGRRGGDLKVGAVFVWAEPVDGRGFVGGEQRLLLGRAIYRQEATMMFSQHTGEEDRVVPNWRGRRGSDPTVGAVFVWADGLGFVGGEQRVLLGRAIYRQEATMMFSQHTGEDDQAVAKRGGRRGGDLKVGAVFVWAKPVDGRGFVGGEQRLRLGRAIYPQEATMMFSQHTGEDDRAVPNWGGRRGGDLKVGAVFVWAEPVDGREIGRAHV